MKRGVGSRPIAEGERRVAFVGAAAVLVLAAAILLTIPDGAPPPPRESHLQLEDVQTPAPAPAFDADLSLADEAARRFLTDYLPYAYGRGGRSFSSATGSLGVRLRQSVPRPVPSARNRLPIVSSLEADRVGPNSATVSASIADGSISYSIELWLTLQGRRWLVDRVGAD